VAGDRNELVELPEAERARAAGIASAHELLELERVFSGIAKLIDELGKAGAPRVVLEMGVVRLATRPPLRDLSELIARLSQLESSSGSNSAGAGAGAPAASRQAPPAPRPPSSGGFADPSGRNNNDRGPDAGSRGASDVGPRGPMPGKDPAGAKPNPFQRFIPPESQGHGGPSMGGSTQPGSPTHGGSAPVPTMAAVTPIGLARSAAAQAIAHAPAEEHRAPSAAPVASQLLVASPTNTQTEPPKLHAAPAPKPVAPVHPVSEVWLSIIAELRKGDLRWAAMFEHGVPSELNRERVTVTFQEGSFFGRQAQTQGGLDALQRAVQAAMQAAPKLDVRFAAELPGISVAKREAAQLDERKEGIKRKALGHPRVLEALKVFPELAQKQEIQVD
jgi:DNA polymerase-3 subunit gamma/tau